MSEKLDVFVGQFGAKVLKRSQRVVVQVQGKTVGEYALCRLNALRICSKGVSISSDVLMALAQHGVAFDVTDFTHQPIVKMSSPMLQGHVPLLAAQFDAARQSRGMDIARRFVAEKLRAQRRLLGYVKRLNEQGEASIESSIELLRLLEQQVHASHDVPAQTVRAWLMGKEGAGAAAYWRAISQTVRGLDSFVRHKRGAQDVPNAMLNYGYAVLMTRVWGQVELAGLHPFCGFLHVPKVGRHSFVLDCVEPWRPIVDDAVFSLLRRMRGAWPDGLDSGLKQRLVRALTQRLEARAIYNERYGTVSCCMQRSIRSLSQHLMEPTLKWVPFRWDARGPKAADGALDRAAIWTQTIS